MTKTMTLLLLAVSASMFITADVFAQRQRRQPQPNAAADKSNPTQNAAGQQPEAKKVYAHAVLIGVNTYRQPESDNELEFPSLTCCVNDMTALRDALVKAKFAKEQDITLLSDASATAENVLKTLREVNGKAKEGDIVLVAFSGHGIALPVTKNGITTFQSYLCPSDTQIVYDTGKKEWNTGGKLIPIKELFDASAEKADVFKIAFLDACRNVAPKIDGETVISASHTVPVPDDGLLVARKSARFRNKAVIDSAAETKDSSIVQQSDFGGLTFAEEDLMAFDNLIRFSSCRKGQQSLEDKKENHSIFMKFVLEALSGKADEQVSVRDRNGRESTVGDGEINLFELTEYVTTKTQEFIKEQYGGQFSQKPSMSANETSTAVIIGYTGKTLHEVDLDNRRSLYARNQGAGRLNPQQKIATAIGIYNTIQSIPGVGGRLPQIPNIPGMGIW